MAAPGNRRNYFYFASPLHPSPFPPPSFPPISLKKSWGNYVREILLNNQQTLPFPSRHPSKHSSHSLPLNSVEFCRAKWALYTSYTCTCGELKFRSHTSLNWFICLNFHYLNHFQRFFITCLFHHRLIVIFLSHLSSVTNHIYKVQPFEFFSTLTYHFWSLAHWICKLLQLSMDQAGPSGPCAKFQDWWLNGLGWDLFSVQFWKWLDPTSHQTSS